MIPTRIADEAYADITRIPPDLGQAIVDGHKIESIGYTQRRGQRQRRLSPSLVTKCTRAQWYKLDPDIPDDDLTPKSRYAMAVGTAVHSYVEKSALTHRRLTGDDGAPWRTKFIDEIVETVTAARPDDTGLADLIRSADTRPEPPELDNETRATIDGLMTARYPDAIPELRCDTTIDGIPWVAFIDTAIRSAETVGDYKTTGRFEHVKMLKGEPPDIGHVIQVGIGARLVEADHGWKPTTGRIVYWPKDPINGWDARQEGVRDYDPDDPASFVLEYDLDLTGSGITALVDETIRASSLVHKSETPPPRWQVRYPAGTRIDPRPTGRKKEGVTSWRDPTTGEVLSAGCWECKFCPYRQVCIESFNEEIGAV